MVTLGPTPSSKGPIPSSAAWALGVPYYLLSEIRHYIVTLRVLCIMKSKKMNKDCISSVCMYGVFSFHL